MSKEFKEKYYVEINPDSEIVRVGKKGDLKTLAELSAEAKELPSGNPSELPAPMDFGMEDVCGHWDKIPICISEVSMDLYKQIGSDVIVGGYCPDCDATFPKNKWVR